MREETSLAIIKSIADSQNDLIAVFNNGEPVLINKAFEKFFSVSSLDEYKSSFGLFVDNFVPHPHYFHKDKIKDASVWFDAILKLPEMERVVSMMTPSYEPHAFGVQVEKIEEYVVVVLEDITQTLIKRIMIENNTNIDKGSGAYAKNYFLQVTQSYQDAAQFSKKIVSAILIKTDKNDELALRDLADYFKSIIRQDDMLIRWGESSFLLIFLVDNISNAQKMLKKLYADECSFVLTTQRESESIKELIKRVES
ncbi:hypothetical protein [Sulfurimonas sp.]|uniref:hypothetical protein n=1 Tax=Sulfurimonas sp. TaxID=2022749 RepID=UPI002600F9AE|nr:hypothetical protein [Sulfurimonas sp.]MBW6488299.1 hypothetical protein [Sulfurimonas sp.]